ncbi:hypothetical protein [Rhodococcus artemisiae]|uniref:Uncharacterized protein n=1 Tax=Rhodococcus artemisiae TaxID=714159 RepID=A0ABU7LAJ3_9NOCA|nr:hypothetical protein [Rhodococcus artemisiae]MEE2058568.1 hypothetical protein [Rhodococcus artemisiae]
MTTTTAPVQRGSVTIQRVLTTASIIACLPYLTLKLSWLAGFDLGRMPGSDWGTTMWIANLGTATMETYAVFLAVAFIASWRRRVPDVVVLLPMWIATGFLAVIVVGLPIQLAIGVDTTADSGSPLSLEPWVWPTVYAGFFVLGISLIANFVLDARAHYVPRLGRASHDGLVLLVAAGVACAVITLKIMGFVESGFGGTGVADTVLIVAAVAVVPALAYAQRRGTTLAAALVWFTGAPFLSIGIFLLVLSVVPDELADISRYATIGAVLMVALGLIAGRTLHSMLRRHQPSDQVSATRHA